MPEMRLRSAKGTDLTPAEADANFTRPVTQKTTTYACLVGDNRSVIECNHATVAFTVTLGDAATMAAAETGDYEVTITNIGAAVVTVARAGSDTIDGAATSLTLNENSSVTLQITSGGDYKTISRVGDVGDIVADTIDSGALGVTGNITVSGTVDGRDVAADGVLLDALGVQNVVLNTKVIDIGDWNMDSTSSVSVSHGLTKSDIRTISVLIRDDADSDYIDFATTVNTAVNGTRAISAGSANVVLQRITGGVFDDALYNATSYNRGWITIQYTD